MHLLRMYAKLTWGTGRNSHPQRNFVCGISGHAWGKDTGTDHSVATLCIGFMVPWEIPQLEPPSAVS